MPVRKVPMNTHAPWMMKHLKDLIQKRQQAFHNNSADSIPYKFYPKAHNILRRLTQNMNSFSFEAPMIAMKYRDFVYFQVLLYCM